MKRIIFILSIIFIFTAFKIETPKDVDKDFEEVFYRDKAQSQFINGWIKISDVAEYFLNQSDRVTIEYKKKKTTVEISYNFYRGDLKSRAEAILKVTYDLKTTEMKELFLKMGYNSGLKEFYNDEAIRIIIMLLDSADYEELIEDWGL